MKWIATRARSGTLFDMPPANTNQTPPAAATPAGHRRGTWVAAGLVLLGTTAAIITVSYWTAQGRWLRGQTQAKQTHRAAAGPAKWDANAADAELDELKQVFEQIAADNQPIGALTQATLRVVERYPMYAPTHTFFGQVWLYQEQLEKAYEQFELSLDLDGQQPETHLLAGTIAYKLGRPDHAIGHYSKAVGLEPSNPRYRLHLAQGYVSQHRNQEARDVLLEALQIDSRLHEAYAALSHLYAQQNKPILALSQIQKAIDHTPASQRAQQVLYIRRKSRLLLRDNQPESSLMTLQNLNPSEQSDPRVLEEMAICWSMLGQLDQAAVVFEKAMVANPTQWTLVANAARWRIKAGDQAAARQHLQRLRQIQPRAQVIEHLEAQLESNPLKQPAGH